MLIYSTGISLWKKSNRRDKNLLQMASFIFPHEEMHRYKNLARLNIFHRLWNSSGYSVSSARKWVYRQSSSYSTPSYALLILHHLFSFSHLEMRKLFMGKKTNSYVGDFKLLHLKFLYAISSYYKSISTYTKLQNDRWGSILHKHLCSSWSSYRYTWKR